MFVLALTTLAVLATEPTPLRPELSPLAFLMDACWAGTFSDGKQIDVHCYSTVFDGAHARDRHAVIGGARLYQGETLYSWDVQVGRITYVYWNSFGGMSQGTAALDNSEIRFPDESYTGPDGTVITISTVWQLGQDWYEAVTTEAHAGGRSTERRVRYHRRPYQPDPVMVNGQSN